MPTEPSDYRYFLTEFSAALTDVRQRMRPILDRFMPAEAGARSFGRSIGLRRSSAWRCWTIAHVADPVQALRALPGSQAWREILAKFEERTGTSRELEALEAAVGRLESLIRDRRLNRTLLRAIAAGGLDSSREAEAIVEARRAATQSMAKLYGVRCATRVTASIVAPGTVAGAVSIGNAGCFDRIARTRPGLPWPIMRRSLVIESETGDVRRQLPLGDGEPLPTVIRSISSRGIVGGELHPGRRHDFETIDLVDVPPARNGRLRVFHAEAMPDTGTITAGAIDPYVHTESVLLPVELLVVDLLLHAGVVRHTEPTASLHATGVAPEVLSSWADSVRLPLEARCERVDSIRLPGRLSALDAGYGDALQRVMKAFGTGLDDFEAFRLVLPHPPSGSMVAIGCELVGSKARA